MKKILCGVGAVLALRAAAVTILAFVCGTGAATCWVAPGWPPCQPPAAPRLLVGVVSVCLSLAATASCFFAYCEWKALYLKCRKFWG